MAYENLPRIFQRLIDENIAVDVVHASETDSGQFFLRCREFGILSNDGDDPVDWYCDIGTCVDLCPEGIPDGSMNLLMYADAEYYDDNGYLFMSVADILAELSDEENETRLSLSDEDKLALNTALTELLGGMCHV